jgi:DNA-binding NarL/FixJ family response regulator
MNTQDTDIIRFKTLLDQLTKRQRQICTLVCQGLPSTEIASQLNITVSTVKTHRSEILQRLELPNSLALANMMNKAIKNEGDKHSAPNPSVCVVEDDVTVCGLMVSGLEALGFKAYGAHNTNDFWIQFRKNNPDVVILDLQLGLEEGLSVAEDLNKSFNCGIVIVSARGSVEDRILGITRGADAYMVKPVDIRELAAVIRNVHRRSN